MTPDEKECVAKFIEQLELLKKHTIHISIIYHAGNLYTISIMKGDEDIFNEEYVCSYYEAWNVAIRETNKLI